MELIICAQSESPEMSLNLLYQWVLLSFRDDNTIDLFIFWWMYYYMLKVSCFNIFDLGALSRENQITRAVESQEVKKCICLFN